MDALVIAFIAPFILRAFQPFIGYNKVMTL